MASSDLPELLGMSDRILVMHKGRARETGTHRELLAAGGHYAELHRAQFAGKAT